MVEWIEEKKYENIAGWLDRQEKQKDGWMDIKNVCMDGCMDKTNRWMVGWMNIKNQMDTKMEDWMDSKKNR